MIQLSFFFMITTVSLWIDRLVNSPIGDLVDFRKLYLATSAITLLVSISNFSRFMGSPPRLLAAYTLAGHGMVGRPSRAETTHVFLPVFVAPLPRWLWCHVLLHDIPLDIHNLDLFCRHDLCFRFPCLLLVHPGHHLPVQLWQGLTSSS